DEWLIDPDNPKVTPAQRKRATDMTLSDFLRILNMEVDTAKLRGSLQVSRQRDPERPNSKYTEEEMRETMEALIRKRHGLPPSMNISPSPTPRATP
ncbi:MAG TPA: hypothetical protein VIX60_06730, partial [Candidatus Cybelea sp.]